MSIQKTVLDSIIRFQQALPFVLPNEYLVWRRYSKKFSKTCDRCNEKKGVYKVTYQDRELPRTVLIPLPVRFCTDCLCKADEKVGVLNEEESEENSSFEINRV